jgi:ribosome-binding protein aMBF1 (putative translation factor)
VHIDNIKIDKARLERGLSYKRMGQLLGVSARVAHRLCNDSEYDPRVSTIQKLERHLSLKPQEIIKKLQ